MRMHISIRKYTLRSCACKYVHTYAHYIHIVELDLCKRVGKKIEPPSHTQYTSPEIAAPLLSGDALPTAKRAMDIFSLGLVFYSLLLDGETLLPAPTASGGDEAVSVLAAAGPALAETIKQKLSAVESPYHELLASMLELQPSERRTTEQILHNLRVLFPLQPISRHGSVSL